MRSKLSFIVAAVGSVAFWLVDAVLLSVTEDMSFAAALGAGAPAARLGLRIVIAVLFMLLAWWHYCRKNGRSMVPQIVQRLQSRTEDDPSDYRPVKMPRFSFLEERRFDSYQGSTASDCKADRILFYAMRIASCYHMDSKEKQGLKLLCYCYDIGKIGLPSRLMLLDRDLTNRERALWDQHIEIGAQIASSVPVLAPAAPLIGCYGERFNGQGVRGLKGEQIPLACRIFTVAWLYDSLIYPTDGGVHMVCTEALREIEAYYAGTIADPGVVQAFVETMGERQLQIAPQRKRALSWH